MADVQIAVIDQQNTEVTLAVPGVQGPTGQTGDVAVAQDGTDALPGIRFENDINTGIYRPGADQLAISTNGTNRLHIASDGKIGIGTTGAEAKLDVRVNNGGTTSVGDTIGLRTNTANGIYFAGHSGGGDIIARGTGGTLGDITFGAVNSSFGSYSERARIDSSGRLLVGTSSAPSAGSWARYARLVSNGNTTDSTGAGILNLAPGKAATSIGSGNGIGIISFSDNGGNEFGLIGCFADATAGSGDYPGRLVFSTNPGAPATSPTERMRIRNDGKILIGTTTVGFGSQNGFTFEPDSASYITASHPNGTVSGADYLVFAYNGGKIGSITQNGTTAVAYNTTSDYRLKENFIPLSGAPDRLKQIPVHRFNFIADPNRTVDGFIAHEVQAVVPEAITGEKDAVDDEGNPVYQGIDQSKLVPLLTAALQEALFKIEVLEQRLTNAGIA